MSLYVAGFWACRDGGALALEWVAAFGGSWSVAAVGGLLLCQLIELRVALQGEGFALSSAAGITPVGIVLVSLLIHGVQPFMLDLDTA